MLIRFMNNLHKNSFDGKPRTNALNLVRLPPVCQSRKGLQSCGYQAVSRDRWRNIAVTLNVSAAREFLEKLAINSPSKLGRF
jgi:hypothetical protein